MPEQRTEKEMYDLILGFAEKDERIRGVILNGSRTNPNVPKDEYRDFDVVYLVTDRKAFIDDLTWLDGFGERLVWQLPDDERYYPGEKRSGYGILLQFTDGNRIDFTIDTTENFAGYCFDDHLARVLMDKDGFLPKLPEPDESSHYIDVPDKSAFNSCRCEFWWVSMYVWKGLKRHQVLYAQNCFNSYVRPQLLKMLSWYAGAEHGFKRSIGKGGDRLKELLPSDMLERFLDTYSDCREENIRKSLITAAELYTDASRKVAEHFGFAFTDLVGTPDSWDIDVLEKLKS